MHFIAYEKESKANLCVQLCGDYELIVPKAIGARVIHKCNDNLCLKVEPMFVLFSCLVASRYIELRISPVLLIICFIRDCCPK